MRGWVPGDRLWTPADRGKRSTRGGLWRRWMSIEDRIATLLEDPEERAQAFRWAWLISLAFLLFGYGYIVYVLFF